LTQKNGVNIWKIKQRSWALSNIERAHNMDTDLYKPGEKAKRSGQYEITGPRGGGTGKERTVVRDEPLPPTPEPGQRYRLVDPTKHKGK
jgi:hypothetical protein